MDYIFRKSPFELQNINKKNKKIDEISDNINNKVDNSLYFKLTQINSSELFNYIIIIIITITTINYFKIPLKGFIGLFVGLVIAYIYYNKKILESSAYNNDLQLKLELIKPSPKLFNNYPELINLFFNIREFYDYNNKAITSCIENVDSLLQIYSDINVGLKYCDKNVDVIKMIKTNALNDLHSVIFSLENNKLLEKKLKKALNELHRILNYFENNMIDVCNKKIDDSGYTNDKKYLYKNEPKAYNLSRNNKDFYEIY